MVTLGKFISLKRESLGKSIQDLSVETNLSAITIMEIERDLMPLGRNVDRLLSYYSFTEDEMKELETLGKGFTQKAFLRSDSLNFYQKHSSNFTYR